jgi:long-chain fatty acid transport protein
MFKTIAIVLAMAASANAAGFRQASQSASSNGMGNAFTAVANDASAVWYNPSLMGDLSGTNVSLGGVFIDPRSEHINTNGTIDRTKNMVHTLPHVYATHKLSDKFAVGLGMLVPFGLTSEWDPVDANTRRVATKSSLKAIYTGLTGSYKVNDKLSVAAGASYVSMDATMNKKIERFGENVEQTLEGDGTGTAWQLAANYMLNSKWNFAANYRSQVKVDIDGKVNMLTTGALVGRKATDKDATTKITLPDTFQLAAAYKHSDKLLFSAEADYTDWTTYRKLVIDYTEDDGDAAQTTDYKYWNSAWAFRVGTEYKVNGAWKLRAGSYYDLSPVDNQFFETRNTCSDRLGVTVGAGYTRGNLSVDFSYLYLKFMERRIKNSIQDDGALLADTTVLNGKYNTTARLPSITVSYRY